MLRFEGLSFLDNDVIVEHLMKGSKLRCETSRELGHEGKEVDGLMAIAERADGAPGGADGRDTTSVTSQ